MKRVQGFTLVELLVVTAVIGVLAAILMPTLARAREATHRTSCANNLKQWGLIMKLYASEDADGRYPRRGMYTNREFPVLGIEADGLYPEYWTDPSIWRCPADMGDTGEMGSAWGIEGNLLDQVARIEAAGAENRDCFLSMLSLAPSYIYLPWHVRTGSELVDAHMSLGLAPERSASVQRVILPGARGNKDRLCHPAPDDTVRLPYEIRVTDFGVSAIGSATATVPGVRGTNDDGSPLPSQYLALREGGERHGLDDVNSRRASRAAQSNTVVMFDAWNEGDASANTWATLGDTSAAHRFNHIPGGANVLFMDGHVAFVPLHGRFPMLTQDDYRPDSLAGQHWRTQVALFGGWG